MPRSYSPRNRKEYIFYTETPSGDVKRLERLRRESGISPRFPVTPRRFEPSGRTGAGEIKGGLYEDIKRVGLRGAATFGNALTDEDAASIVQEIIEGGMTLREAPGELEYDPERMEFLEDVQDFVQKFKFAGPGGEVTRASVRKFLADRIMAWGAGQTIQWLADNYPHLWRNMIGWHIEGYFECKTLVIEIAEILKGSAGAVIQRVGELIKADTVRAVQIYKKPGKNVVFSATRDFIHSSTHDPRDLVESLGFKPGSAEFAVPPRATYIKRVVGDIRAVFTTQLPLIAATVEGRDYVLYVQDPGFTANLFSTIWHNAIMPAMDEARRVVPKGYASEVVNSRYWQETIDALDDVGMKF